ncbi:SdrD B-like domain-containing protein [Corynebacterium pilbarense]|uniref:SdrD B-like domain-containing protein n=1 Tax=Corynebacterium pilbarense TaxID=1288393 RepID=UPI0022A9A32C
MSTVALGIGGAAVPGAPVASAWEQQDIPGGFGIDQGPVQETTARFWAFDPETLQPDGSYTYTIEGSTKAPKPLPGPDGSVYEQRGASNINTMTVWVWAATPNTTLQEPTPEDFKWASGTTRPFKNIEKVAVEPGLISDADGNEIGGGDGYKIDFEIDAAEDSFKADVKAQLNGEVPAGTQVTAASYVESEINPQVFWDVEEQWIDSDPENTDTCAGIVYGKHILQGGGYGQWMAEMYLGSLNGNLELRGAPRVTFTLPNRSPISGAESGMTQGDVNSEVLHKDYKKKFEETNTGTVWGQKFDWPFDGKTATGTFWLPTGTVFEFEQNVYDKSKPCSDDKWGGDKLHHRAMLTSAAPAIVESDSAYTTFALPEGEEPCDCELGSVGDKVWVDTNKNGAQDEDETQGVPGVRVTLQDASGREIARTVTDEDGNWNINVKPGEYTVVYEPGNNVPSKTEQVERTVTIKPGEKRDDVDLGILPSGSVGDRVWNDEDGDGKQGEDEKGIPNVIVEVSREGEPTRTTYTDENGNWAVKDLTPDAEYEVRFIKPEGWEVTGKVPGSDESGLVSKVAVESGGVDNSYDLGLKKTDVTCDCEPEEPGTIGDRVWVDENGDGEEDPDEKTGVPNVVVVIKDKDGNEVTRTVTDENGNWKVDVEPGDYVVDYVPGENVPSQPNQVQRTVTIKPGEKRDDVDLGILPSGSVGDRVWNDEDGDGEQGENEKGLENVVVLVSREGEPTRSAVTDANGDWKIEGLNPNVEYDIRFVKPEGWEVTGKVPGSDESGLDSTVTVEPNEYNNTYDLGLKKIDTCRECESKKPNRLGDLVWVDTNGNGKQDPDETEGAPDVTVIVRDGEGNEVTRTVTDEEGKWKVDVPPGDYEIEYRPRDWKPTDPEKVTQTATVDEGDEGKDYLDFDLGVQPKEPTPPEKEIVPTTVTTTATTKVPTPGKPAVPTTVTKEIPTTIQTTTTAEAPKRSTIGDKVWEDTNGDGKEDPDEKTGIPNVPVVIVDKDGNEVTRTVSDEDGNWKVDVEPGEYTVEYVPGGRTPSDKEQVERTITVEPGEDRNDIDLGILPSGSVGDRVWNDEDGDGKQGENEKGLENVVVLVSREGEPTRSAVTDANGDWKIEGLNPNAEYDIRFVKPEGWEVTGKVPGSDESGLVSKVTVKPNEYNDSYDLGLKKIDPDCDCEPVKPGAIGNRVWIDHNGDGKQDPNETEGAPDVTVIVRDKDGNEVTRTVTDEDGNWKVDVEPGDYEIEYRPRDWKPTDPKRVIQKVTVEEGKDYLDLDLGVQKPKPGEPTPPTEKPEKGSSSETLDRCVANAVRSPLLYLVPVALLGAFGGEIARPYMGAINEQVNQINAQFQEAMRRNSPDWGHGGRGGRDNDQFAELRGQIDAANRRIAELGQDPNVQRFGTVAAGIIGLIAAGGVLYDWCSNEKGEAFTSIGGSSAEESGAEGRQSSSKDAA